jgi:hypothetical protein
MNHSDNCLFCKIAAGAIPSRKVYEDDELFAFHDINPWAPVHFLLIPKEHIPSMAQVAPEHAALLGRMMVLAVSGWWLPHRDQHRHGRRAGGAPPAFPRDRWAQAMAEGLGRRGTPCRADTLTR